MQFRPHDYQKYAVQFIKDHPVSALFLQMGLGKSVITLTAINDLLFDSFEVTKVLVIAPIRVCQDTWPKEIRKWDHLSMLRYSVAVGTEKERLEALRKDADIYIINRENIQWLVEKSNMVFDYDCVVIDELSSFKSHQSKRFRALMKVRPKVKRVIGLTGTPSSNGLMDLWAQFRILDMGERLGRYITQYRLKWFQPDRRNGMQVFSYKPLPGAEEGIYRAIGDITVSMKSTDHLDMPECIFSERTVHLDEGEKRFYSSLKDELVAQWKGLELTASNAAVLSGKLLQLANGMVYGDDGSVEIHSRKLDALEDLIEEANGNPVLVAYWFHHDYERISEKLRKLGVVFMDLRSEDAIDKWNRKELAVGLIHPASAGHGLNLQEGGDTIIWYGPIWSLELYEQTNARLWRQGQKSGAVVVQHIIAEGTIDEKVMAALHAKSDLQEKLMEAVKAEARG